MLPEGEVDFDGGSLREPADELRLEPIFGDKFSVDPPARYPPEMLQAGLRQLRIA